MPQRDREPSIPGGFLFFGAAIMPVNAWVGVKDRMDTRP
jgi:hypothetical protein